MKITFHGAGPIELAGVEVSFGDQVDVPAEIARGLLSTGVWSRKGSPAGDVPADGEQVTSPAAAGEEIEP